MKRKAIISVIVVSIGWLAWDWLPLTAWVKMTKAVWTLRQADLEKPVSSKNIYEVNTYTDECSTQAIRDYYHAAAQALCAKSSKTVTYMWADDVLYYGRVSTLLMTPNDYIEVVASHNNDNNGVEVIISDQPFSEKGRHGLRKLESYKLPEGFPPEQ